MRGHADADHTTTGKTGSNNILTLSIRLQMNFSFKFYRFLTSIKFRDYKVSKMYRDVLPQLRMQKAENIIPTIFFYEKKLIHLNNFFSLLDT